MKRQLNGPILIFAAGATVLILIAAVNPDSLRALLALLLVFFLPGFALTVILFQRERLGIPERILLGLGLSIALTAFMGLILNTTPWGLRTASLWTALLLALAVEIAVIIFVQRPSWMELINHRTNLSFTLRQWVFLSLAAVVTIMAVYVARSPARPLGFEGYTTLWIQPADVPDTLRVGVTCEEFQTTKYQIRFELNGVVREGPTLELRPGETWEGVLRLASDQLVGSPFTVLLYRLDDPDEVYRHAVWWPESE